MFKHIVYVVRGGVDLGTALEEFFIGFVDQTSFMQYFKGTWVPNFGQISWPCTICPLILSLILSIFG